MPVRELSQIPAGECRLLPGDGIERDARVRDDPLTVLAGDVAVLFEPVRLQAVTRHACRGRADLVLGLEAYSLLLQGAVIDPRRDAELRQALVDMVTPCGAPVFQQIGPVPGAD